MVGICSIVLVTTISSKLYQNLDIPNFAMNNAYNNSFMIKLLSVQANYRIENNDTGLQIMTSFYLFLNIKLLAN